jgi:hypothetical protein
LGAALQADGETRSVNTASSIRRRSAAFKIKYSSFDETARRQPEIRIRFGCGGQKKARHCCVKAPQASEGEAQHLKSNIQVLMKLPDASRKSESDSGAGGKKSKALLRGSGAGGKKEVFDFLIYPRGCKKQGF